MLFDVIVVVAFSISDAFDGWLTVDLAISNTSILCWSIFDVPFNSLELVYSTRFVCSVEFVALQINNTAVVSCKCQ